MSNFDTLDAEEKKNKIFNVIADLVSSFLYYDRKGDEELGHDDIQNAVQDGVITAEDIVERFAAELEHNL